MGSENYDFNGHFSRSDNESNYVDLLDTPKQVDQGNVVMTNEEANHFSTGNDLQNGRTGNECAEVAIKQEYPKFDAIWDEFNPGDIIDLSDTDDDIQLVSTSVRRDKNYKHGTAMEDGTILLSDGEDEEITIVYDDGSSAVTIKKENPDIEFLGANKGLVDLPQSDSDSDEVESAPKARLAKPFLRQPNPNAKRTPAQIAKMQQLQRVFARKTLANAAISGAGGLPPNPRPSQPSSPISNEEIAWMRTAFMPNTDPAIEFLRLKKEYKAKRKARKNTLENDVDFKKAQQVENDRLRRLAQQTADSDSEEAEESDDGLFMLWSNTKPHSSKRPFASIIDDDEEEDGEATETDKPNSKKPRAGGASSRVNFSSRRARAKAREKEERSNMLAGIEAILLGDQKRQEARAAKEAEQAQGTTMQGMKKCSKKKKSSKDNLPTRTETGRMNNVDSLLNSNVYDDSNANLGYSALPVITEKKKKEFLSTLIASIPLEDRKQARSDKADVVKASQILSPWHVKPDGKGNWSLTGMNTSLFHYQVQGSACMKKRETGTQAPYGGILADQMGLGKTVMTIATMIANRQSDPGEPKCTLIVCSPALMTQWERELAIHAREDVFSVIARHHSHSRYSGKGAEMQMETADIILTTYGEVVRSYPRCILPKEITDTAKKEEWWAKYWDQERDLLHRTHFHRVVLDESHIIKNYKSQTSIACRALMAKHRWALSGTPISNRLEELFPYFKFLRVKHTGSIGVFRQNFCLKDNDVCNKRLHSMLEGLMIRRTHQNKLFGAPLVQLPRNTQTTVRLQFNEVEMGVYVRVRARCVAAINAIAQEEETDKNFNMVLIMFQRLRQMSAHIFMVQEVLEKEFATADGIDALWDATANDTEADSFEHKMLSAMKKMLVARGDIPGEIQEADIVPSPVEESPEAPVGGSPEVLKVGKAGSLTSRFGKLLRDLKRKSKWKELRDYTCCHKCKEPPEDPLVTNCLHVYCKECLSQMAYEAAQDDLDETSCLRCGTAYNQCQSCEGLKELQVHDFSVSMFHENKNIASSKEKFKLTMNYVDSEDDGLILSTKMIAVKAQLEKWISESRDSKIIIFTEWHMVMHILSRICQQNNWNCCHYNGKMSQKARDRTLNAFHDDPALRVMIASLKCGGTGLNLTVASKVICVDLWYNDCVEQQAFCRVHRIGQKLETYITRFMVEDTVDERLIAMQKEKKEVIGNAIDDDTVLSKLSLTDLMKLFGPVSHDENSKPFILVQDIADMRYKKRHVRTEVHTEIHPGGESYEGGD